MKVTEDDLQKLYKQEQEKVVSDLRELLRLPAGKRYFWRLLETCHMFSSTFTGNSTGNFMEGERNVGLKVFRDILQVDPKLMGEMAQSHAANIKMLKDKKAETLAESTKPRRP